MYEVATYNGFKVYADVPNEMVNLTNLWKADGSVEHKNPWRWLQQDEQIKFIEALRKDMIKDLKCASEDILPPLIQTKRGRHGGGTWTNRHIAWSYAEYLSPELKLWCQKHLFILFETGSVTIADNPPPVVKVVSRSPHA